MYCSECKCNMEEERISNRETIYICKSCKDKIVVIDEFEEE